MFLALLWKCHIFQVSVFHHITTFGRCFSLIFDYLSSVAKNLPFHAQCKMKPLITVLYENSLFWKMWKTFDFCFSFSLSLSLLDRSNKILENNFSSLCFLKLSETELLSSVIIIFYKFVLQTGSQQCCVGQKKIHPLPLMKPLYIIKLDWSFLKHVLDS